MKEVIVTSIPEISAEIVQSPIPVPGPNEVLIKVVVSGCNPKDWKYPLFGKRSFNSGDDIAGYVEAVGEKVFEFKKGDRVAAFHEMGTPHGSFAEYAVAYDYTTFLLPPSVSFEEAATLPLVYLTASYGLFTVLKLPLPFQNVTEDIPLLVYGASTSVGAFTVKLAKLAGISPVIGVAGAGKEFAKSIGADYVIDYRDNDHVAADIRAVLKPGQKLLHVFDTVSERGSLENVAAAVDAGAMVSTILPGLKYPPLDAVTTLTHKDASVAWAHNGTAAEKNLAYVMLRMLTKWLADGAITAHPHIVKEGGLAGVADALKDLYDFKISAAKYVFRIADTPGL
ncbi:chaperonin 10-like protein [Limtongia smithiae]|uniref:chaperonin 10-like protein n=1 Tax=Limtongia smithiae TaxID=1125753 RepID=UPI0034CE6F76